MNLPCVSRSIGFMALLLAVSLLVPTVVSLVTLGPDLVAFVLSAGFSALIGLLLIALGSKEELRVRESFAVVTGTWLLYAALGGLPFLLSGALTSFTDSFFETMSGFTTTGTTVIADVEVLPNGTLFWRSFTQWIGGMGMIVLSLAVLHYFGSGGGRLLEAEASGLAVERLVPRIQETAKRLWGVYVLITLAEIVLLILGGMPAFDAVLHTFATLATGGFSPKNASIAAYPSAYLQWVVIVFMFLSGTNFSLHYFGAQGKVTAYWKNAEFRLYLAVSLVCIVLVVAALWVSGEGHGIEKTVRDAAFQVLTISTTTGFVTVDYEAWPFFAQGLLLVLMLCGACTGSTAGGIKFVRLYLMWQYVRVHGLKLIHRKAVKELVMDGRPVPPVVGHMVVAFMFLYLTLWVGGSLALTALGMDIVSALSAVAANMGNVGPGLGMVGPTDNYAAQPAAAKWLLSILMMAGRLEVFPFLALFSPWAWRK